MRGLQGAGVPIAACVKHWVADGGTALGSGTADFAWTGTPPHVLDPSPNPNPSPSPNPNPNPNPYPKPNPEPNPNPNPNPD